MGIGESIVVVVLFGLPVWLAWRVWRRYLALDPASSGPVVQTRIGLVLVSVSTCIWVGAFAIMTLQDYSGVAKSAARHLSPGMLGLSNIVACVVGLLCVVLGRKANHGDSALRHAITISSGCLILIWLFVAMSVH
jgi:hypothetical protein